MRSISTRRHARPAPLPPLRLRPPRPAAGRAVPRMWRAGRRLPPRGRRPGPPGLARQRPALAAAGGRRHLGVGAAPARHGARSVRAARVRPRAAPLPSHRRFHRPHPPPARLPAGRVLPRADSAPHARARPQAGPGRPAAAVGGCWAWASSRCWLSQSRAGTSRLWRPASTPCSSVCPPRSSRLSPACWACSARTSSWYGPEPSPTSLALLAGTSALTTLLACVPLYTALRASGSRALATAIVAPLAVVTVLHILAPILGLLRVRGRPPAAVRPRCSSTRPSSPTARTTSAGGSIRIGPSGGPASRPRCSSGFRSSPRPSG